MVVFVFRDLYSRFQEFENYFDYIHLLCVGWDHCKSSYVLPSCLMYTLSFKGSENAVYQYCVKRKSEMKLKY